MTMQALLVNQSPVSSITYSNKMRVIYDGVEQDAELRKYPSGKIYFRTENSHFVPVNEVGVLIPLTKGKSAIVDFEDYEYLMQWKWHYASTGYAARCVNYKTGHSGKIWMHRSVTNAPESMQVDHKFGNRLDNRKANLRICTQSQNLRNRGSKTASISGFKGVYLDKKSGKWKSSIRPNGKYLHIGYFACHVEAAKAYNDAAVKHYGEFAWLNNIPDGQ